MNTFVCFKCKEEHQVEGNEEEGYSSIVKCPNCKSLNSINI